MSLLSLTPNKQVGLQHKLQCLFSNVSGVGWLSKNAVDAFVSNAVRENNEEIGFVKFGFLCCDNTWLLLNNRITNFNEAILFGLVTGTTEKSTLRENLLFPLLWQNHFVLIWFNRESKQIKLLNSLKQDDNFLLSKIKSTLIKFLSNIDKKFDQKMTECESQNVVLQNDSSSCGVCVCMTADAICTNRIHLLDGRNIAKFRDFILFKLFNNSDHVGFEMNDSAKLHLLNGSPTESSTKTIRDSSVQEKQIIKRKKIDTFLTPNPGKTILKEDLETFEPKINLSSEIAKKWENISRKILEEIVENIAKVANLPLKMSQAMSQGYRHSLFLENKLKSLQTSFFWIWIIVL